MKIAVTSHGENLWAPVDTRFGRADYFVLYDQETESWDCVPNKQNLQAAHGAGIQAGQALAKTGANVLITGHVGPKAFRVLNAGQIQMYSLDDLTGSVEDALAAFQSGKLTEITAPNGIDIKK